MKYNPLRRKDDRGYGRIITFFRRFFTVIGIAAFISASFTFFTLMRVMDYQPPSLPDNIVLMYKVKSEPFETTKKVSFKNALLRPPTTLHEIAEAMDIAKKDARVKGLIVKIENMSLDLAQIQEIRDAVHRFRKHGKFAMVFSNDYIGMGSYYLSSAFDEIWIQPMGMVAITGMHSEVPFLKGIADKIGVYANFNHRGKYKSAVESLTRNDMSNPHREMLTAIIEDISNQIVSGISIDRGFEEKEVKSIIDKAPYVGDEPLNKGLVDKIDYYDRFIESAKEKSGKDVEIISLLGYSFGSKTENNDSGMVGFFTQLWHKKDPNSVQKDKNKIALIYGSGMIMPSKDGAGFASSPMMPAGIGGTVLSANKISAAFREASKNDKVSVIVFRIDSPGGSPSAAETLRRSVIAAQEKGKKVVVSMGSSAASGGYWAVVNADYIIAEPATLTGSIGVFAGKMVFKNLWKKLGVAWESVGVGENSDMWSNNSHFSKTAKIRFEAMLDNIYDNFISRVAEGRGMSKEEVEKLAQGRVWTGRQAKEVGLVDGLGGVESALSYARGLAGFKEDEDVPILHYPARKSTLEILIKMMTEGSVSINNYGVLSVMPNDAKQLYNLFMLSKNMEDLTVFSPMVAGFSIR